MTARYETNISRSEINNMLITAHAPVRHIWQLGESFFDRF